MAISTPASLSVSASRKHAVVEFDRNPSPKKIRDRILADDRVCSGFEALYAPAPCYDESRFLVLGNDKTLLVGACFMDSVAKLSGMHSKSMADELEIVIDPFDDGIGFVQFYFNLSGREPTVSTSAHRDSEPLSEVVTITHLPYPEAQSSAFDGVRLRKYRWWDEAIADYSISGLRCRWLFAWFDTREVFRNGKRAGFNIARNRPYLDEFGTWNHASGNGSQDALSLGKLYRGKRPAVLSQVQATRKGSTLTVTGTCCGKPGKLKLSLLDPAGEVLKTRTRWKGEQFTLTTPSCRGGGRYRLQPVTDGKPIEPGFVGIDVLQPKRANDFQLSLTYDAPMCVIANHYTPTMFDREFAACKSLGLHRIHWIEYGDWPSFWTGASDTARIWAEGYKRTVKACGDYLTAACKAAHRNDLQLVADFKTFDIGMNCFSTDKPYRKSSAREKLDQNYSAVIPEIAAAQGATWQANPAWQRKPNLPVTRVVLYSDTPIDRIKKDAVKVLVSKDNRNYTVLRGATVKTGECQRPHQRWTPAGNVPGRGRARNWYLEITGIKTNKPYLAVKIAGEKIEFTQRGFMFAEAFGADGQSCVVTPATSGSPEHGFHFWKGWPGWTNQTPAVIQRRSWASDAIGLVFDEDDAMATLLEPAHEQARKIWLGRIKTMLAAGVDGVDIRSYCHHNGPMHYLKYAFAEPVLQTFRSLYGRDPQMRDEDYERIRNIRGDCYTDFIAAASKLVRSKGKKFIVEVESGIEVPASMHVRMQLPMQWRRWINEGLVDEVRLKWFSPWSVYAHEEVLPLARKHDVPVHVISRCLHSGPSHRFQEVASQTIADAVRSGFSGYNWYEQQNFMDRNQAGYPMFKGPIPAYFQTVRETLKQMGIKTGR